MWLKTDNRLIDLSKCESISFSGVKVHFYSFNNNSVTITKNSSEAAQALFEHVAQMLEAKE